MVTFLPSSIQPYLAIVRLGWVEGGGKICTFKICFPDSKMSLLLKMVSIYTPVNFKGGAVFLNFIDRYRVRFRFLASVGPFQPFICLIVGDFSVKSYDDPTGKLLTQVIGY